MTNYSKQRLFFNGILLKALILFRIRVNGTKLPYLWLFLPALLRIAPYALIISTISDGNKGLQYIQVIMITAPCSVILRRLFRIRAIHERLPRWINSNTNVDHSYFSFSFLTIIEFLPSLLIFSLSIFFSTNKDLSIALRFLFVTLFLIIISLIVVVAVSGAILVWQQHFEDVRFGTRYSFMGLSLILFLCISSEISSQFPINQVPFMFFVNVIAYPYGSISALEVLLSFTTTIALVIIIWAKYPVSRMNAVNLSIDDTLVA